jgi:hypothetical protein
MTDSSLSEIANWPSDGTRYRRHRGAAAAAAWYRCIATTAVAYRRSMGRLRLLQMLHVVAAAALLARALSDDSAGAAGYAELAAAHTQQPLTRGPAVNVNPYLAEDSPYDDTNGDGQLTTDEVREQWEGFMAGVLTAAGEEDWATVIELSYKLLHDPGPTEANIRYNLAFALNAVDEYAKAKGELKSSIKIAREAGDEKNAERSECVRWLLRPQAACARALSLSLSLSLSPPQLFSVPKLL